MRNMFDSYRPQKKRSHQPTPTWKFQPQIRVCVHVSLTPFIANKGKPAQDTNTTNLALILWSFLTGEWLAQQQRQTIVVNRSLVHFDNTAWSNSQRPSVNGTSPPLTSSTWWQRKCSAGRGRRSVPPKLRIAASVTSLVSGCTWASSRGHSCTRTTCFQKGRSSHTSSGHCTSSVATQSRRKHVHLLPEIRVQSTRRHGASTSGPWSMLSPILRVLWWVFTSCFS